MTDEEINRRTMQIWREYGKAWEPVRARAAWAKLGFVIRSRPTRGLLDD